MNFKITTEQEIVTKEVTEVEVSLLQYVGYKVEEQRKSKDINIAQLARRMKLQGHEISHGTLCRIEKGQCPLKIEDLLTIASYFDVKMGVFFPEGVL